MSPHTIGTNRVPPKFPIFARTTGATGLKELSPEELLAEDEDSEAWVWKGRIWLGLELGGGFKCFLFSPLPILTIFFKWVGSTTN